MTTDITIRRLSPADGAEYRECRLAALRDAPTAFSSSYKEEATKSEEEMAGRLRDDSIELATFGAFDRDKLVGIATFYREDRMKRRHKGNIVGVYVRPEYRECGVGKMIVAAAIEEARGVPGIERLELGVEASNEPAKAVYRSLGFVTWGTEPAFIMYHGKRYDEEHMTLALK